MRIGEFPLGIGVLYADNQGLLLELNLRWRLWVVHAMAPGGESAKDGLRLEPAETERRSETTEDGNLAHITREGWYLNDLVPRPRSPRRSWRMRSERGERYLSPCLFIYEETKPVPQPTMSQLAPAKA